MDELQYPDHVTVEVVLVIHDGQGVRDGGKRLDEACVVGRPEGRAPLLYILKEIVGIVWEQKTTKSTGDSWAISTEAGRSRWPRRSGSPHHIWTPLFTHNRAHKVRLYFDSIANDRYSMNTA